MPRRGALWRARANEPEAHGAWRSWPVSQETHAPGLLMVPAVSAVAEDGSAYFFARARPGGGTSSVTVTPSAFAIFVSVSIVRFCPPYSMRW